MYFICARTMRACIACSGQSPALVPSGKVGQRSRSRDRGSSRPLGAASEGGLDLPPADGPSCGLPARCSSAAPERGRGREATVQRGDRTPAVLRVPQHRLARRTARAAGTTGIRIFYTAVFCLRGDFLCVSSQRGGRARCELTHAAGWFLPPLYGALRGCDGSILPVVGLAQGLRASCPDKVRWHRLPNRAEAGRGCFRANEWMRGSARTARSHSVVCGGRRAHHDKRACSLRGRFIPLYFYTGLSFSISSSHSSKFIHSIANVPLEIQQDPQRARGHGRVRVRCAHAHAAGWFFPPCGAI